MRDDSPPGPRALHTLCAACMGVALLGCATSERAGAGRSTDSLGRPLPLGDVPGRVVSLAPNLTEILYRIGAGNRIVGVTTYCDFPAAAREKPTVGDFSNPSLERVVQLAPDIVLMSWHEQAYLLPRLESLGLDVAVFFPESVDELVSVVASLAELFKTQEEAQGLIDSLHVVAAGVDSPTRPSVFVEICFYPLMTADDHSFVGHLVELAGGDNVGENLPRPYCAVSPESVVRANPDVMLLLGEDCSREDVLGRLGWERVAAVQNNAVCDTLDPDLIVRPGPRVVNGWASMVRLLHPEIGDPFAALRHGSAHG